MVMGGALWRVMLQVTSGLAMPFGLALSVANMLVQSALTLAFGERARLKINGFGGGKK